LPRAAEGHAQRARLCRAHLLDIAPTVLELLEIEAPEGMRGMTLAPRLAAR
jgi:bisphosphoglycerate-independent phosphoglycerate mutase (AlkP superfamily)